MLSLLLDPERNGHRGTAAILAGEGHQYVPFSGQSAGLVHDIHPAADVVRSVAEQVRHTISRLSVGQAFAGEW